MNFITEYANYRKRDIVALCDYLDADPRPALDWIDAILRARDAGLITVREAMDLLGREVIK